MGSFMRRCVKCGDIHCESHMGSRSSCEEQKERREGGGEDGGGGGGEAGGGRRGVVCLEVHVWR